MLANAVEAVRTVGTAPSAAEAPGAEVVLTAEATTQGGVRIVVRDRGVGIDGVHASQIFEPYFTTRRAGTGLGLPITRNIIEGLGGTIVVRPADPGTTVEMTLPRGTETV